MELGADRVSGNRLPHTGGTFSATLTGALARGLAVPAALELAQAKAVNAALSGASPLLEHGAMIEPMAATYAALGVDPVPVVVSVASTPKSDINSATP